MTDKEKIDLLDQIKIMQQTILEVRHAQYNGSDWYTKGSSGLYQQVSLWLNKGQEAINKINKILETFN